MTYQCKHFKIQELVPPQVYEDRGEKAWALFDDRTLITADLLRDRYGPCTINDWLWGGDRQWSGLRTPDSPYYSPYSQHTFGRAFDGIYKHVAAEEIRQDILKNPDDPTFKHIMSLELGVGWLHVDMRNCSRIFAFHP